MLPATPVARVVDVTLEAGHAEAHGRASPDLGGQPHGMHHGPAVCHAQIVDDLVHARLDIELDLDEAGGQRGHGVVAGKVVAGDPDQPGARQTPHRPLGNVVQVVGELLAAVASAQLDGPRRGPRVAHAAGRG